MLCCTVSVTVYPRDLDGDCSSKRARGNSQSHLAKAQAELQLEHLKHSLEST
jgi:hypothetical protein